MGSAGCGTSYTRWQNVRSPSTDHDVHPARRCGNESRQRGGLGLPGSSLTGTTGSSRQNIADHPTVCGSFLVEASQSPELRSARTRLRESGPSMESLRSSSQLKFFPETAVSWRRRWQKTQTSILWQKLATRDGALAVRSDRLNFQGFHLQGSFSRLIFRDRGTSHLPSYRFNPAGSKIS